MTVAGSVTSNERGEVVDERSGGLALSLYNARLIAARALNDAIMGVGGGISFPDPSPTTKACFAAEATAMAAVIAAAIDAGGGGPGGGVTSVGGTPPIASSGGATPTISIAPASGSVPGSMSSADFLKLAGIASGATAYGDEQAQDAVGAALTDTATIDLTYNDLASEFTADLRSGSVDNGHLANMSAFRVKGRASGTGSPQDLTGTQITAMLDEADGSAPGMMPTDHYDAVEDLIAGVVTPRALSLSSTFVVAAGLGVIVPQRYTVASGGSLRLGAGAVFEVS